MDAALIERIETNVERLASAVFAGAVGFAMYSLLRAGLSQLQLTGAATAAAMFGYVLCARAFGTMSPRKGQFIVPRFVLDSMDSGKLLLTDSDRLPPAELLLTDRVDSDELLLGEADRLQNARPEPLVLDDILAELGPDSRVVRLFDRKAMPTPGQLKSRIDDHLEQGSPAPGASDASQALSDALAQLRRSLR